MNTRRTAILIYFLCGLGIPFSFMAISGFFIAQNHFQNTKWQDMEGVVSRSEVTSHQDSGGETLYGALIEYNYQINGQLHFGSYQSSSSNWAGDADTLVSKYSAGKSVVIKVNPQNPSESALPEKPSLLLYIFFGVGLIAFCIFGYAGLRFGFFGVNRFSLQKIDGGDSDS